MGLKLLNILLQTNILKQNEIYIFNKDDLHFVHANEGAIRNCGYSLAELQKMTPLDLKPKLNKAHFLDLIEPLNTQEQIHFQTYHQPNGKTLYPAALHLVSSVFNPRGVYVAFVFDISTKI